MNNIEFRLWRQFVAVAEELHFGRAAQRLAMTQPPLTQAIAQLERTLGVQLFERTSRRVQLTPAGDALLPDARDLLARAQRLPQRARAAADGEIGRVRLGFVSTIGFERLPEWVRAFREASPEVALELVEATGDVQSKALARGEIDAGLMLHSPGFAPAELDHLPVLQEPLVLAVPANHALADDGPLAARDMAAVLAAPLVIFPRRIVPSLYDALFAMYHAAGQSPQVAQEAIQMQTIVNLVSAGIGVAWVPESVTRFRRDGVVYRALPQRAARRVSRVPPIPACETSLVWHAANASPAVARFVRFISNQDHQTHPERYPSA